MVFGLKDLIKTNTTGCIALVRWEKCLKPNMHFEMCMIYDIKDMCV